MGMSLGHETLLWLGLGLRWCSSTGGAR
jgi:hypothetical protein